MKLPTLDEIYPDNAIRPHASDPAARLRYMELAMKHVMALANSGAEPERIRQTAEEALGWRKPCETTFALANAGGVPRPESAHTPEHSTTESL